MKADLLSSDAFLEHVYNKERNIIMAAIDNKKIVEAVLYILNVTKGLDYYHVFKVLYFAEREHLKLWGTKILADDFVAMEYGPSFIMRLRIMLTQKNCHRFSQKA